MSHLHRPARAVAATLLVLSLGAAGAEAATKTMSAGAPPPTGRSLERQFIVANTFFPSTVTINEGDSVNFALAGFHNIDLPPRGSRALSFVAPTNQMSASTDAAGQPFWFSGRTPIVGFNTALLKTGWGKAFAYTGAKRVNSGLPLGANLKPMKVRFTKRGSYNVFCDLHPGMRGKVNVRRKGAAVPSSREDARAVAKQVTAAKAAAQTALRHRPPTGTIDAGAIGAGGIEALKFFPAATTVPVGTTLTFRMPAGTREPHTATAGPGSATDQSSYVGSIAKTFESPAFDSRGVYSSEAPGSPPVGLTSALHGNGFWNSGLMDAAAATPLPGAASVRFDQAGTFDFYCLIHPFMKATVTAQ